MKNFSPWKQRDPLTDDQLTGQRGHVRSSPWFWDLLRKMVLARGWSDGLKSAFSSITKTQSATQGMRSGDQLINLMTPDLVG